MKGLFELLTGADGYFLCNNERDVSQSDFKNRLMPMTTVRVAPYRDEAGFFLGGGQRRGVHPHGPDVQAGEPLRAAAHRPARPCP
jgi:hypothetical protein